MLNKVFFLNLIDQIEEDDEHHYTSLKDIMWDSSSSILPCRTSILNQEGNYNEFSSSKIGIRDPLVKSAASAYLQSTAILVTRDENCLFNLWGNLNNNVDRSLLVDARHRGSTVFG